MGAPPGGVSALLPLILAAGAWSAPATAAATVPDTLPLVTLSGWAEDVWLDVLDREGAIHGPLADEGILQRFHADMDPEYALDVRTGLFTAAEDVAWGRSDAGIRAAAASISHPHILNRVDWRQAWPVAGSLDFVADYRRDHSLTRRRDYPRLGVRWSDAGGSGWTLWSRLGLHFFKPAADVELGAAHSWPAGVHGEWRLDLRAALLDAFSDIVFVNLGVDPDEVEAHRDHAGAPLAGRVRVERRSRHWRIELHGGATTRVRGRVTFPGTGADPFDLSERVTFAGALMEVAPSLRSAVAGYARLVTADSRRTFQPGIPRSLRVAERTEAVGGYFRQRITDIVDVQAELHATWRPETRTDVRGTLEHEDREVYGAVALVRRPPAGWTGRLAYTGLDRDAGALLPEVTGRNHRLVTEGGYRTRAGFRVAAGLRWDLDRIGDRVFDGAHLRLSVFPSPGPRVNR